jgi:hypothetical protein
MRGRNLGSIAGLVLLQALGAASAPADPPTEDVKIARKRFQEGVAAVDAGNYEAARVAFRQAYALKPHPSVLRNLGQAELRTGRYLEAARHLSTFVRDTAFGTVPERDAAAKSLAQAETRVGRVLVHVDVAGADITVDGELAGRSPISDPFYAEPGDRVIRIQKEGYVTYEKTHVVEAGRATQLQVELETAAVPTRAASISRVASSSETEMPQSIGAPPPGLAGESDSKVGTRTLALVSTGGLALASAGVWLGFGIRGVALQNQADDVRSRIHEAYPDSGCASGVPACAQLRDLADRRATANGIALAGGIATGVSAAAFAAVYFFWPKSPHLVARADLLPVLSSEHAGLMLQGTY